MAAWLGGRAPVSGRALLRQVRASFYRTLFLAFVAAVVVPVVALAIVTRAYMATSLRADIEREATRTAASASRVVEDFASIEARGATNVPVLDDSLLVWLSRVIGEDINVFAGTGLLASSERNLFASGLLPTRTPGRCLPRARPRRAGHAPGPRVGRHLRVPGRLGAGAGRATGRRSSACR